MQILRIFLLLNFLWLSACSTTQRANNINPANVQGLVGVTTSDGQNSANFNWYEDGGRYHIELYGPLGVGSTYLDGNNQSVTLTLSDQESYTATSAEILMQNVLGWSFPVEGLKYWLFAHTVPNVAFTADKDSKGHITHLTQQGWGITYTWSATQDFPKKIVLTRPGIKVVIAISKEY